MGNVNVKRKIKAAKKTKSCELGHLGLRKIPGQLLKISDWIAGVNLSFNKLDDLRPLRRFIKLRYLNVSNNRLLTLPEIALTGLRKLHTFVLNDNLLFHLPPAFAYMSSLVEINLANNRFNIFPVELCLLPKLEVLDLSGNTITHLPTIINRIQAIEINLNQNNLSDLCSRKLGKCLRLRVLQLEGNNLAIDNFLPDFLLQSKVSFLAFNGNNFKHTEFAALPGYSEYMKRYTSAKELLAIPP